MSIVCVCVCVMASPWGGMPRPVTSPRAPVTRGAARRGGAESRGWAGGDEVKTRRWRTTTAPWVPFFSTTLPLVPPPRADVWGGDNERVACVFVFLNGFSYGFQTRFWNFGATRGGNSVGKQKPLDFTDSPSLRSIIYTCDLLQGNHLVYSSNLGFISMWEEKKETARKTTE